MKAVALPVAGPAAQGRGTGPTGLLSAVLQPLSPGRPSGVSTTSYGGRRASRSPGSSGCRRRPPTPTPSRRRAPSGTGPETAGTRPAGGRPLDRAFSERFKVIFYFPPNEYEMVWVMVTWGLADSFPCFCVRLNLFSEDATSGQPATSCRDRRCFRLLHCEDPRPPA